MSPETRPILSEIISRNVTACLIGCLKGLSRTKKEAPPGSHCRRTRERELARGFHLGGPCNRWVEETLINAWEQEPVMEVPGMRLDIPEERKDQGRTDLTVEEVEKFRVQAFRAIVKDNQISLEEVLNLVPRRTWSRWENRAGADLLELSEERKSWECNFLLSKYLGMVKEAPADEEFQASASKDVEEAQEVQSGTQTLARSATKRWTSMARTYHLQSLRAPLAQSCRNFNRFNHLRARPRPQPPAMKVAAAICRRCPCHVQFHWRRWQPLSQD